MASTSRVFYGPFINPVSLTEYAIWPRCLLAVDATGNIAWIVEDVEAHNLQDTLASKGHVAESATGGFEFVELKSGQFVIPGFVDTHTHAPQVPNIGTGGQYQLLQWLENVTFPMEAKFADVDFARKTYESVVRRFISGGTTTCCYYGSLHLESTKILADIVHSQGQRAFIGKCNMNRESTAYYVEPSVESSVQATEELISHINALPPDSSSTHEPRVQPIITPRFAISCTGPLLESLGTLASTSPSLRIQTHISENPSEVVYTHTLFPDCPNYASVYDKYGLLRNNTVLAHAVHLTKDEVKLIKEREAGISHCPTSNFNLSSGVAPVGWYLDEGIKVGLGTDISGGFSYSILDTIRDASIAAKVISFTPTSPSPAPSSDTENKFTNKPLPIPTLFYLATMGGAAVCSLSSQIGSFAPGKSFDALLVDVKSVSQGGNPGLWVADEERGQSGVKGVLDGWLERFLFCGDDRNIDSVFVQGRVIGGRSFLG